MMQYWVFKSEPTELNVDDLAQLPKQTVEWFGVRNYQARNYMRDTMQIGDLGILWHSSCKEPGIYGIVKVVSQAHPDSHQFEVTSKYYDAKSTRENPRWWCVDVQLLNHTRYISIANLRSCSQLANMQVLKPGNRLSVSVITPDEWHVIYSLSLQFGLCRS